MIIHQSLTECKQPFAFNDIGVKSIDNAHTETFWYDNKDSFITWVILYEIQWSKGPKFSSQSPISHSLYLCLSFSLVLFITLPLTISPISQSSSLILALSLSLYLYLLLFILQPILPCHSLRSLGLRSNECSVVCQLSWIFND